MIKDILSLNQGSLSTNLSTDFVVGKTVGREKRDLLTSGNGTHDIDSGDTGLNHFLGVVSLVGVDGFTVNIEELFGQNWGTFIDGNTGTIEGSAQHFFGNGHLEDITSELTMSVQVINIRSTFENLFKTLKFRPRLWEKKREIMKGKKLEI